MDDSFESFVISLDLLLPQGLTLTYIVDWLLNDEMRHGNKGVEVKKETALLSQGQDCTCWQCGRTGHIKAFFRMELAEKDKDKGKEIAHLVTAPTMLQNLGD